MTPNGKGLILSIGAMAGVVSEMVETSLAWVEPCPAKLCGNYGDWGK